MTSIAATRAPVISIVALGEFTAGVKWSAPHSPPASAATAAAAAAAAAGARAAKGMCQTQPRDPLSPLQDNHSTPVLCISLPWTVSGRVLLPESESGAVDKSTSLLADPFGAAGKFELQLNCPNCTNCPPAVLLGMDSALQQHDEVGRADLVQRRSPAHAAFLRESSEEYTPADRQSNASVN